MRDVLIAGGVVVGGYVLWRWWMNRPITQAQTTAPSTVAGSSASTMNTDLARSTVFGGGTIVKNLLAPVTSAVRSLAAPLTGPAAQPTVNQSERQAVYTAIFAPQPVAPSPSGVTRVNAVGLSGPRPTLPPGDPPPLGTPSGTYFSMRGIAL